MFIKKLELFGFKTFAEKTEIQFSPGMTVVVGPNGCGKSNINDALMWVLGESNIRNIRGQRATDVIFNGSEKRKALGMAEVSLTLDNSCGTLPLSFSEVTVTRRAYRSGEAEYFINKSRCRLKDIYELFLDTGIGRDAYSFITQGEIDAILSAKPEDRRVLLEEAAGIKKYRYRRQEALRKLDKTQANLHRVCDIMSELEGQLEPLREQSEQAIKYNDLQSRLREIEIGLLIRDLHKFTDGLEEVREIKKSASGKMEEYDCLLADLELEKERQSEKLKGLEEEVENARRLQSNLAANVQRLESKAAVLGERLKSVQSDRNRTDDEITSLEHKIEETRTRIKRLEHEEAASVEAETKARAQVESRTATLAELDRIFEEASRGINDQKASYLELAKELATKRNALQNSRERVAQIEAALKKYDLEIADLEKQKTEAEKLGKEASNKASELEARIGEIAAEIALVGDERKRAEAESADLNKRHTEITREVASKSSRLNTLREMAEAHEGFYEGVRSVMAANRAGKLRGGFAVVADVITVPKGYETAIETALGGSVQDIIADTVDESKQAIAFLKQHQAGRATFLPLDGMRNNGNEVRGRMDRRSGALGIASDLIKYNRKYDPAVQSLLGRTVIAETIDDAVALSKELSGWNRIVSLEGDLIVPSGAITGGARKSKGPGLLVRKQEIDTLTADVTHLENKAADLRKAIQTTETRLDELRMNSTQAEKSLSEARIEHTEQRRRVDFSNNEASRLSKQYEVISLERDEAQLQHEEESSSIKHLQDLLQTVGQENKDLDEKVAGAEQQVEELQKRRSTEREELMRLNVELAGSTERAIALKNALAESRGALDDFKAVLASRQSQADGITTDVAVIVQEKDNVEAECKRQRELLAAADRNLSSISDKRALEQDMLSQIDSKLRQTNVSRSQLAQDSHDADVKEARLEVQLNQVSERLMSEYEVTTEQAMAWPEEIEIERGTASEVARLRREIKDMGPVNTGAIVEYERIKERWDFLTEQRTDLESARDQINDAIREIDTNTHGLFMETFNSVVSNFDMMFKRLFGGGKTELLLTNPNDLLETGIDVIVQPPGKKLQDMALLSGGERALTACALAFALLLVRPSPFVVMDEVDAPLDESNVERFAEVLREFSNNSQFIVVTHNRSTMESADSLYGVTMQEPGVSKLISVKLAAEGAVETQNPNGGLVTV